MYDISMQKCKQTTKFKPKIKWSVITITIWLSVLWFYYKSMKNVSKYSAHCRRSCLSIPVSKI